jgi:hypothetical protein
MHAQVHTGLFVGINSTGFGGDRPAKSSYAAQYGYQFGAHADFYIAEDIAINFQPIFTSRQTNVQYDVNYQYEPYDSLTYSLSFIELPVQIKVMADNQFAYVTAGLAMIFPIEGTWTNNRTASSQKIDDLKSLSINAQFGVGIQFSIGRPSMFVELSYIQGLTNLTTDEIAELGLDTKLKLNSIQLNTGVFFSL